MHLIPRRGPSAARTPGAPRRRSLLTAVALAAGSLTGTVAVTVASAPQALADTPPAAPAGWTTVFSDNFAGAAGTAPNAQNWFYDIGTGYGTGETEQTTNSTSNVYLDGNGHLVLKATDNEAQLAGVLAHEIVHVTEKHSLKTYQQQRAFVCNKLV